VRSLLVDAVDHSHEDDRYDDNAFVARLALALHGAGAGVSRATLLTATLVLLDQLEGFRKEFPERLRLVNYALEAGIESRELQRHLILALAASRRFGRAAQACELLLERWGDDSQESSDDRILLGDVLALGALTEGNQEMAQAARGVHESVLAVETTRHSPDEEFILVLRVRSARALWFSGEGEGAQAEFAALLEDATRALGEDHPVTHDVFVKLNSVQTEVHTDDPTGGMDNLLRALEHELASLDPQSEEALRIRSNIAVGYFEWDRLDETIAGFEALIVDEKRWLGETHDLTLESQDALGRAYAEVERFDDALRIDAEVLEVQSRILSSDDTDILRSRGFITEWLATTTDPRRSPLPRRSFWTSVASWDAEPP
jgi:tetratricopeptide (TPR) repeat protein